MIRGFKLNLVHFHSQLHLHLHPDIIKTKKTQHASKFIKNNKKSMWICISLNISIYLSNY